MAAVESEAPVLQLPWESAEARGWNKVSARTLPLLCGAVAMLAFAGLFVRSNSGANKTGDEAHVVNMDRTSWTTEWALGTAGYGQARQFTIFRPSLNFANYRLQFSWDRRQPVGCVLRWKDPANYYGIRMQFERQGLVAAVVIDRFAVVNGTQRPFGTKVVQLPASTLGSIRVGIDVLGPVIKTQLQNQMADYWTYDEFATGAAGFFSERNARAEVENVSIAVLTGTR